jgi:hypothetical protein
MVPNISLIYAALIEKVTTMNRFIFKVFLLQIICFCASECIAKDINVSTGVEKRLIIKEKNYDFIEKVYLGNNLLEIPVEKGKLNLKSPENTLINVLSSMYIGDYEWRKQLVSDVVNIENYEKFMKFKNQANTFFNNNVYIDKRFEFKQLKSYVVVEISVVVKGRRIRIPYTFYRNIDGDWQLCLQCTVDEKNDLYLFLLNNNFDFEGKEKIINKRKVIIQKSTNE